MSQPIVSVEGRRVYIQTRYGDPVVAALKNLGAHWDAQSKRWWLTSAKRAAVEAAVAASAGKPSTATDDREVTVVGKARYKGRSYYVRWAGRCKTGEDKMRLCTLDGKLDFWVAASAATREKEYDEARSLDGIRRFVEEKRREEEQAKAHAAKIRAAAGEDTRRIPRVTDERIIRSFFGARAVTYDYEVTHEDFDRDDNEGPGHYYGITVPSSLADRWDAGIAVALAAGHKDMRCREALTLRYRAMHGADAALPPELEALLAEREQKDAAQRAATDAAARKEAEEKAAVDALLDGLERSSVGPTSPATVTTYVDGRAMPHHMATSDPGDCTFGGEGMARLSRNGATYVEGRTTDGRRVVRENYRGYDDYRTYYWAPADVTRGWALAYAAAQGITAEQAREWLSQYGGCHGADLYRVVAERETAGQ